MMITKTNQDSDQILHLINPNTIGAEVGVWEGSSSSKFVKKNLKKLYLVDPYSVEGYEPAIAQKDPTFNMETYLERYKKLTGGNDIESFNRYYDKVHARVVKKFKSHKEVEVVRKTSTEWFEKYDGEKLDWIYIDGDHSYTGVINDLNNCLRIMKEGGLILGDDYKWESSGDKGGVKKAVNEFVQKMNLKLERHGNTQFSIRL